MMTHQGKNPYIIYNPRDMFTHFGPVFPLFVLFQIAAGAAIWIVLREHTGHPPAATAVTALHLLLCAILDSGVFLMRRGHLYTTFVRPAAVVALLTIAPGLMAGLFHLIYDSTHPWNA